MERNYKECGKDVTVYDPVTIIHPEAVVLKNHIAISEFAYLAGGKGLHVGNFIHLAAHTCISGGGTFVAEDFTGIAAGSILITGTDDVMGKGLPGPTIPDELRAYERSFIHCGKHSFIGSGAIIHPGVTIGEGAVVGSGSVVTRSLDPWGVYVGQPARRVKDRPREEVLEKGRRAYEMRGTEPADFSDVLRKMKA